MVPGYQTIGADLSLVTVGLSLTVAKGFPPPRKGAFPTPLGREIVFLGEGVEELTILTGLLSFPSM